jgi:ABC-type multidrug transport system fused ATPase/permease subunit
MRDWFRLLREVTLLTVRRRYLADTSRGGGAPPAALTGGIALHEVSFRYPASDRDVLKGVNLHLPAATTVAIVGANGAGKSTLVKLLTAVHEPTGGHITIDDRPPSIRSPKTNCSSTSSTSSAPRPRPERSRCWCRTGS